MRVLFNSIMEDCPTVNEDMKALFVDVQRLFNISSFAASVRLMNAQMKSVSQLLSVIRAIERCNQIAMPSDWTIQLITKHKDVVAQHQRASTTTAFDFA